MIVTAFLGYVLPWGQMSFWGATVITNLFSAVPIYGQSIVNWLWGGFSVDNATLTRFYSLHFILPFIILGISGLHLFFLHMAGSNNPLGITFSSDSHITFSPYYLVKDLYGIFLFLIFYALFLYFVPNYLGHPDNYTTANPMVTPAHIVPEWYFLPFYAILQSIPDKLFGVLALAFSIITLFLFPLINQPEVRSMRFRPFSRHFFWYFLISLVLLTYLGGCPIEQPYVSLSRILSLVYFGYFFIISPTIIFSEIILANFNWTLTVAYWQKARQESRPEYWEDTDNLL